MHVNDVMYQYPVVLVVVATAISGTIPAASWVKKVEGGQEVAILRQTAANF